MFSFRLYYLPMSGNKFTNWNLNLLMRETYADYGIETGSKVEVYGSTDGTIQEVGSGNDKEFKLTVQWDKYVTYLKDGAKEVLIFSYVTYREDGKLTITGNYIENNEVC